MSSARQFIGAATTASSLITGAFLLALAAGNAQAQGSAPACDAAGEIALLPSPWVPWKGASLRVMLVTEKPLQGELSLTGLHGSVAATSRERHGGPPYFWFTEIKAPAAGSWHATLTPQQAGAGCGPITREIKVRPDKPGGPGAATEQDATERVQDINTAAALRLARRRYDRRAGSRVSDRSDNVETRTTRGLFYLCWKGTSGRCTRRLMQSSRKARAPSPAPRTPGSFALWPNAIRLRPNEHSSRWAIIHAGAKARSV